MKFKKSLNGNEHINIIYQTSKNEIELSFDLKIILIEMCQVSCFSQQIKILVKILLKQFKFSLPQKISHLLNTSKFIETYIN
jgi:hypothetical protein